jgi:hypothetical protein
MSFNLTQGWGGLGSGLSIRERSGIEKRENYIRKHLGIPDDFRVVAVFGFPSDFFG